MDELPMENVCSQVLLQLSSPVPIYMSAEHLSLTENEKDLVALVGNTSLPSILFSSFALAHNRTHLEYSVSPANFQEIFGLRKAVGESMAIKDSVSFGLTQSVFFSRKFKVLRFVCDLTNLNLL